MRESVAAPSRTRPPMTARHDNGADVIDYTINGHEMQYVEIELDPGESAIAEAGAMM